MAYIVHVVLSAVIPLAVISWGEMSAPCFMVLSKGVERKKISERVERHPLHVVGFVCVSQVSSTHVGLGKYDED